MNGFNPNCIPRQRRKTWFVQRGDTTWFDRGFRSKLEASEWINSQPLDWRVGFMFRLRGDDQTMRIVNRQCEELKR